MTAAAHRVGEPMTLDEFLALPEDSSCRYELADGALRVKASPPQARLRAAYRLVHQLNEQLAGGLEAFAEPDVVVKPDALKGRVRIPDVAVILAPYQLVEGNRHYRQRRPLTGVVDFSLPWPLTLDLDALTAPR